MSRLPTLLIIGALLVGAAVFGTSRHRELQTLQAQFAVTEKERDELRQRVTELQRLNRDLATRPERSEITAESADRETAPARPAPANGAPGFANRGGRQEENRFANLLARPEVQQLLAAQQKAGLDGRYAALFRKLGLQGEDLEKFKNLLVEKQSATSDVMAAARSQGMTGRENRDELRELVAKTQAEVDESIRTTLGESVYTEYKNYEATLTQRRVANQLEQRLSYSAAPLTPTQVEQLVQILHETAPPNANRPVAINAGNAYAEAFLGGSTRITDTALARAQGILSQPQLTALQNLQREQQAAAQLAEQMRAGNRRDRAPDNNTPRPPGGR